MKVQFRSRFVEDLEPIKDQAVCRRIRVCIEQVEKAAQPREIPHLKKLKSSGSDYRIRVGEYRLGVIIEGGTVTFVRCLNRKEIYRFFP